MDINTGAYIHTSRQGGYYILQTNATTILCIISLHYLFTYTDVTIDYCYRDSSCNQYLCVVYFIVYHNILKISILCILLNYICKCYLKSSMTCRRLVGCKAIYRCNKMHKYGASYWVYGFDSKCVSIFYKSYLIFCTCHGIFNFSGCK